MDSPDKYSMRFLLFPFMVVASILCFSADVRAQQASADI